MPKQNGSGSPPPREDAAATDSFPGWAARLNRPWVGALVLVLAVVLAYQPVWHAEYIWDDDAMLTGNPCIAGPLGLKEIWTTNRADICPLTLTTLWAAHALWGLHPLAYHLLNVLLHAAAALVLWRVLRSLGAPGAWLGAALWALHPVQVESVAWVSELKNIQSGFFFFLSILFFVRSLQSDGRWNYPLTLLFAALALASKSSTVILPVVLGLCAVWQEGRLRGRILLRIAPVLLLSLVATVVSMHTQAWAMRQADPLPPLSWPERLVTAGDMVWFYLGKLLWPHPLVMIYPLWQIEPVRWISWLPLVAVFAVLLVLWAGRNSWGRAPLFAFASFLVALLPVAGFAQMSYFRYSYVADHFQYLAAAAPLALAAAGWTRLVAAAARTVTPVWWTAAAAVVLLAAGGLSWYQAGFYQDREAIWTLVATYNPRSPTAHNDLGWAKFEKGKVDEAMAQYRRAIEIDPNYFPAYDNLGLALQQGGKVDEAMKNFTIALKLAPKDTNVRNNIANAYFQKGRLSDAIVEFQDALNLQASLHLDSDLTVTRYNMANTLARAGRYDEAIANYEKVLAVNPSFSRVRSGLADALLDAGRPAEAIPQYRQLLVTNPNLSQVHDRLGQALFLTGQIDEAIAEYQTALNLNPRAADTFYNLGNACAKAGRRDDAIAAYEESIARQDNVARVHNNLGIVLAESNQVDQAVSEYKKALQLDPHSSEFHNNLGNALAQKGQPDAAMAEYRKAFALDPHNARAHNNLGMVLARQGNFAPATAEFQAALRLKPDYTDARNNLTRARNILAQQTAGK